MKSRLFNLPSTRHKTINLREITSDNYMSMSEITVLKQITDSSTKHKTLMKLINADEVLLLKDKFHRTMPLRVKKFENSELLYCKGAIKSEFDFSHSETYTAHFQIESEKYMFEATPSMHEGYIVLNLKRLYYLQNRKMVRYKVPTDVTLKLVINSINEESCLLDCSVTDLNSMGCSLVVKSANVTLDPKDIVDATLIQSGEDSIQIQGVVRNVRPMQNEQIALGLEFHHMIYSAEDRLTSMISDLHHKSHLKSS